jgi:hypothetical protein
MKGGRAVSIVAALMVAALLAPPASAATQEGGATAYPLTSPQSDTVAPLGSLISGREAIAIADRTKLAHAVRRQDPHARAKAWLFDDTSWEVHYYPHGEDVAEVDVSPEGDVVKTFTGAQAGWYMARGHYGHLLDSPWLWAALIVLFVAPFFDFRRPLRLLHLDLLVLLGFGVSHIFFTRGDVDTATPLVYPVLGYLLVRMLVAGARGRRGAGSLVPHAPVALLAVGLVLLVGGRIAVNVVNDQVIDVGDASVAGAVRIAQHDPLYGRDERRAATYGPFMYLAYLPFAKAMDGASDHEPPARAAAITFDLLTLVGLFLLGIRMRAGPEGRRLGLALAWAWAAYPYSVYALGFSTNDVLVSALLVFALVPIGRSARDGTLPAAARGALLSLATAAKFAPIALAPLLAAGQGDRRPRKLVAFALPLAGIFGVLIWLYLPAGGLRELYDTTVGYQIGRASPFSLWGLHPELEWLQTLVKAGGVILVAAVYLVPRRRSHGQVVALAAAVIITLELSAPHWFYLYIVWFAPLVLAALFAEYRTARRIDSSMAAEPRRVTVTA